MSVRITPRSWELEAPQIKAASPVTPEERPHWRTWTDDYSNLIQILK